MPKKRKQKNVLEEGVKNKIKNIIYEKGNKYYIFSKTQKFRLCYALFS